MAVTALGQNHLASLDDGAASCKGERHDFPKLRPGRRWPKNLTSRRIAEGVYQLTYSCPDCGTERRRTTLKGGILSSGVAYNYKYPRGYLAPPGAGLTKADYVRELGNRVASDIEVNAKAAESSVAEAKFQSVPA